MTKILLIVFLCSITVGAQTPNRLHQKYGAPVAESYIVRPGIVVTAILSKDGEVCEMVIEPQRPFSPIKSGAPLLKSQTLAEVIDELVPPQERGKFLMGTFLNLTCLPENNCSGTGESYERVYVYRNGGDDAHRYATIQWNSPSCRVERSNQSR